MQPKITCLLCSHNKPEYVGDALKSLWWQEYHNWECIVKPYDVMVAVNRRTPKSLYGPTKE